MISTHFILFKNWLTFYQVLIFLSQKFHLILELNREQTDSLSCENLINNLKKLEHYLNFQDQQVLAM